MLSILSGPKFVMWEWVEKCRNYCEDDKLLLCNQSNCEMQTEK